MGWGEILNNLAMESPTVKVILLDQYWKEVRDPAVDVSGRKNKYRV